MKEQSARLLKLIGRDRILPWVLVVLFAFGVGVMELVGALLIYVLLGLITGIDSELEVPILGDVRSRFPDVGDETFLLWTAGAVAAFFLIRAVVTLFQSYVQQRLAQGAGVRLALRLLRGYLNAPYSFNLGRNSSEHVRNVHNSVIQIVQGALIPTVLLISETLLIIGLFVALLLVSTTATLLTLGVMAPLVLLLLKSIKGVMSRGGRVNQETNRATLQVLQESFQGIRDIKVLSRERFFERRFAASRVEMARALYMRGTLTEVPHIATETMLVTFIVVFLAGAVITNTPLTDLQALLGTFGYVGIRLLPTLNRVVSNANNLQFALPAVTDVVAELEVLEAEQETGGEDERNLTFAQQLELEDVHFSYNGSDPVLQAVNITIARGEWVGIVGSTGSGKSTLIDIMLGLLEPAAGDVKVDGISIRHAARSWQRLLGIVPQTTFLLDDTLKRNIAFGLEDRDIDDGSLERAVDLSQLRSFVETLPDGLETFVGERGVRLSGGQRQRVAIARALYRGPEVLFFDEATSALDNVTETELIEAIERLHGGHTVIMVAHRLSTVRRADKIIVLENGRVTDHGTFDELLERNSSFKAMTT